MSNHALEKAAQTIAKARHVIAFTGAGISVESGIAPFRGPGGIWTRHDPRLFDKNYFRKHPGESWKLLKKLFYDGMGRAKPNAAHEALGRLEHAGHLHAVITQNIDGLHQKAGNSTVLEYHGTLSTMQCMRCRERFEASQVSLDSLPPLCPQCDGVLKPDIVFFSEPIDDNVHRDAQEHARSCDACIIVGTSGEVMPAGRIPIIARNSGATVIEVNPRDSAYTYSTCDHVLQGKAGAMLSTLADAVIGK